MNDVDTFLDYQVRVSNRFKALLTEWSANDSQPEEIWSDMKDTLSKNASEILGKKRNKTSKAFPLRRSPRISKYEKESKKRKQQRRIPKIN